jgi:hypothetical protein
MLSFERSESEILLRRVVWGGLIPFLGRLFGATVQRLAPFCKDWILRQTCRFTRKEKRESGPTFGALRRLYNLCLRNTLATVSPTMSKLLLLRSIPLEVHRRGRAKFEAGTQDVDQSANSTSTGSISDEGPLKHRNFHQEL